MQIPRTTFLLASMPSKVISLRSEPTEGATPDLRAYLAFAAETSVSARLYLRVAEVEIGRVDVVGGRVVHAELPGAEGDAVLPLLAKLPPVDVTVAPYRGGPSTVSAEALARWRQPSSLRDEERAALVRAFAVLDPVHTPDDASPGSEPTPPQADASPAQSAPESFDDLFARAMRAYLQRHHAAALELFERCARLRPHDRRVDHNMERLRARLRKDP